MTDDPIVTLEAAYVFETVGKLHAPGYVVVQDGVIVEIGSHRPRSAPTASVRVEVVAPLPVNAHTHLDLSLLPFRPAPFDEWLNSSLRRHRHRRTASAALHGWAKSRALGVRAVGDTIWSDETAVRLGQSPALSGVLYREVLEPRADQIDEAVASRIAWLESSACTLGGRPEITVGISFHSPYTVHATGLERLAKHARHAGFGMQVHVAERPEEMALFRGSTDAWDRLCRFDDAPSPRQVLAIPPHATLTPVTYLEALGLLGPDLAAVHCCYATADDWRMLAHTGTPVVLCPRSNSNLGLALPDIETALASGVQLAIGTDGSASSGTLDPRDDVRFLFDRYPSSAVRKALIRAAITGSAQVLRLSPDALEPGTRWQPSFVWF